MKKSFSERLGLTEVKNIIQIDSINDDLKNALWNSLYVYFFENFISNGRNNYKYEFGKTFYLIWTNYFNNRIDEIPVYVTDCVDYLKKEFFNTEWYKTYNLIEFIISNYSIRSDRNEYIDIVNEILEKHLSGYRIISNIFSPITNKKEIESIVNALEITDPIGSHLVKSLELLSDKTNPDYRNSIKESISAVETITRLITKNPSSTLGKALSEIEREGNIHIHEALKKGFSNLYGWTSNDQGIRHSLMNEPTLSQEDALYMLVACSAFVNYLYTKSNNVGIRIE